MKNLHPVFKIIIWIVVIAIFIIWDKLDRIKTERWVEKEIRESRKLPKPDPNKGTPIFYSLELDDWVYSEDSPRAKAPFPTNKPYYENLDDYLRKKIPGYEKNTYWGQEYDLSEIEDEEDLEH